MALEDKDIFFAICNRFADQPIEFIMDQYEKAKKLNMAIEQRAGMGVQPVESEPAMVAVTETVVEEVPVTPKKRYTKRSLKVKPQDAITDDAIFCCICGEQGKTLTAKHLATHDLTVEEYKKLCGYPPEQKLMSNKHLAKSREIIKRAQQKRIANRQAAEAE